MSKQKELKAYSVGMGDSDWIKNCKETTYEDADIVVFPGGADINPAIYNENVGVRTSFHNFIDDKHIQIYKQALNDGKYIIGICRGAQLMCGMQSDIGGKLIQHVTNHSGTHLVNTISGRKMLTNSIHHQMLYPWNMPKDSYQLIGQTLGKSECYLNGDNKENEFPDFAKINGKVIEPEIVWFPRIRGLAIQFHPEMMVYNMAQYKDMIDYLNDLIRLTFNKQNLIEKNEFEKAL